MGEVIKTPKPARKEQQSEEKKEEVQQEVQNEQSENSSDSQEVQVEQIQEAPKEQITSQEELSKMREIKNLPEAVKESIHKWQNPILYMLAGAALVLVLLVGTNHLVWTQDGPQLLTMNDAYQAGINRGVKNVEAMPWYSRVWRGFTGDYHSK